MKPPWLIVSGDFVKAGGMNQPNYEFARYLADEGIETHLVAYRVADELAAHPRIVFHRVPKPGGSYFLSQPLIAAVGRRWARVIAARGGRVIVNGAVCDWNDVNWVHHVQAVFAPQAVGSVLRRLKGRLQHRLDLAAERRVLPRATVAITNSDLTGREIVKRLGLPADRIHTVYLGIDPLVFRPPSAEERVAARARLVATPERPQVAFVGALGDSRKGFDSLFRAWLALCAHTDWDADLIVVGAGSELALWRARTVAAGVADRIRFLDFDRSEAFIARLLWGCDALVLPSRYEGYGRPVQEALCCGVPALVSTAAGIAEQYPPELVDLLIADPEDADDLAARLRRWRSAIDGWRERVRPFGATLRAHTWRRMAEQMVAIIERGGVARHSLSAARREVAA
ncbi:MAG TPA: glycosyltransferase family 4 protein [Candidatus Binataceae bacterium]|nr:glycosyltransferase family 4 protein [Candidatus Binataceae bacterium]